MTHAIVPYVLPNGVQVADDFTDLTDGALDYGIDRTETNQPAGAGPIWTGTDDDGIGTAANCNNWTSSSNAVSGSVGFATLTNSAWTNNVTLPCNLPSIGSIVSSSDRLQGPALARVHA